MHFSLLYVHSVTEKEQFIWNLDGRVKQMKNMQYKNNPLTLQIVRNSGLVDILLVTKQCFEKHTENKTTFL